MTQEIRKIKSLLKQIVKDKKQSYESLSSDLQVSPATIKRQLNSDDLSLSSLILLCETLDVSFYDLIEQSRERLSTPYQFTTTQENFLANNFDAFLLLRQFIARRTFKEACRELNMNLKNGREILAEMDRANLIEWHKGDKIKLMLDFPFKWAKGGPLEKAYSRRIFSSFFNKAVEVGLESGQSSDYLCKPMELALNPADSKKLKNEFNFLIQKYMSISEYELKFSKSSLSLFSVFVFAGPFSPWSKRKNIKLP